MKSWSLRGSSRAITGTILRAWNKTVYICKLAMKDYIFAAKKLNKIQHLSFLPLLLTCQAPITCTSVEHPHHLTHPARHLYPPKD